MRLIVMFFLLLAPLVAQEFSDPAMDWITTEVFYKSQVQEYAWRLTEAQGPRTTGSPAYRQAANWLMNELAKMGLRVREEKWEGFDTSWEYGDFQFVMTKPFRQVLSGLPYPWTPPTRKPIAAPVAYAPVPLVSEPEEVEREYQKYFAQWRGKLKGKVVLISPLEPARLTPVALRKFSDQELADFALAPKPCPAFVELVPLRIPRDPEGYQCFAESAPSEVLEKIEIMNKDLGMSLVRFYKDEGALAVVRSLRGPWGNWFPTHTTSRRDQHALPLPSLSLAPEDYNQLVRLGKKMPAEIAITIETRFTKADTFNIIADLPGSTKAEEMVMLGAHLDGIPFGQAARDNAGNVAVLAEAMRILKFLELPLARTVRLAVWDGEEQGLLGSRAYAQQHRAELTKIFAYFNLDSGPGRVRGIYAFGDARPTELLLSWLAPWKQSGSGNIALRSPFVQGRSDGWTFHATGVPSYELFQDPLDHRDRTWHSLYDRYDFLRRDDMTYNVALAVWITIQAANARENLPRRP